MRPSLDALLIDAIHPGEIVFIDDTPHRFLKRTNNSDYVFFLPQTDEVVCYDTTKLVTLQAEQRYYRPGTDRPAFPTEKSNAGHEMAAAIHKRAFLSFRPNARERARARWRYVSRFLNEMRLAEAEGKTFARSHENALRVIDAVDQEIDDENAAESDPSRHIQKPRCRSARSLLRWLSRVKELQVDEVALVHVNAARPHRRRVPREALEILASQIRSMVSISPKLGPSKIYAKTKAAIRTYNLEHNAQIPAPSLSTVQREYRRYDAWRRLAAARGRQVADTEYGTLGKLQRPQRILDLVEIDHHQFDLHGIFGSTPLGNAMSAVGLDRFWVCMALDVHSNYPLGFSISFEPGGLLPALTCIDHAIRPKRYVRQRWPDIDGELLGFGKPVRLRYDNAKEFVGVQLQAALARLGIGFELAAPGVPQSKPYVERFFGTIERDFVHWLPGATGSGPHERGDRKPLKDARIPWDDFVYLFHKYLIEVYARRPQQGLDGDTPEQRWLRGATSATHRPRELSPAESAKLNFVASIELDVKAGKTGFTWRGLTYNSRDLQQLRRYSGVSGRTTRGTPLKARIPLADISRAYVSHSGCSSVGPGSTDELEVPCTNPHVKNRTVWQHEAVRKYIKKKGMKDGLYAYEAGFNRLFRAALSYMGVSAPGAEPIKGRLTNGFAPRFAGGFAETPWKPATLRTQELIGSAPLPDASEAKAHHADAVVIVEDAPSVSPLEHEHFVIAKPRVSTAKTKSTARSKKRRVTNSRRPQRRSALSKAD